MTLRAVFTVDSDDVISPAGASRPLTDPVPPRHDWWCARRSAGEMPSLGSRLTGRVRTVGDATAAPGVPRLAPSAGSMASPRGRAVSELAVSFERRGDVVVARLAGNLDIYTVSALNDHLATVDWTRTPLVLDLTRIDLLGSSGLGALIVLRNRAAADGRWVGLVSGDGQLRDVLGIAGLDQAFLHARDIDSACSLLAQRTQPAAGAPPPDAATRTG